MNKIQMVDLKSQYQKIKSEIDSSIQQVIDSTAFIKGKIVDEFADNLAKFLSVKHVIPCGNGTDALQRAILSLGLNPSDEIICPSFTFIASAEVIGLLGFRPVFVDVDKRTMGMSAEKLEAFLKENARKGADGFTYNNKTGRRFAAVVPMHTFGHPCDLDGIVEVCERYNIPLVEDSAESIGSYYKGKHTGLFGKLSALSFNGNKVITTGGGGMILTQDEELAKLAKHITTTAKVPHRWEYNHDYTAYNYRLTNLAAALGLGQIEQCDYFIEQKRKLTDKYKEFFADKEVQLFTEPENCYSNY